MLERDPDAIVLVAHGSRSPDGQDEMAHLVSSVQTARPRSEVRMGYLELCRPAAADVVEDLLARGRSEIVVVPLMLHAAGHTKSDVPAVVVEARAHHPEAHLVYARPLGTDHALLSLGRRRLREAGGLGIPLAVFSRGSSDPDANAEAYRVGRLLADMVGAPMLGTGFSGITWPTVPEALDQLHRLGAERIAALAWYLATGVLIERMRDDFRRFQAQTGIEVVDAGHLGTGPEVAALVCTRVDEALSGHAVPNCDACAYRRPFPGLEDRVGLTIGVGHSHLAAEHRVQHAHPHTAQE